VGGGPIARSAGGNGQCLGHLNLTTRTAGVSLRLLGADDLEVLVDEDVVGPVDADGVDFVLAVAQLHHTVDDSSRVRGQGGFGGFRSCRSDLDCPRPLGVAAGDRSHLLRRGRRTLLEGDHRCGRGRLRSAPGLHNDLGRLDGCRADGPDDEDVGALFDSARRDRVRTVLVFRGGTLVDGHLLTRRGRHGEARLGHAGDRAR